ncbi:L-alanine exporter AlaE, partial [Colwellia marinimaniae]|uniref:L-alanine exporter AlaE n=1 Tax=Colwellia marinimaniae TaxID=1513592 RepID=UPI001F3C6DEA
MNILTGRMYGFYRDKIIARLSRSKSNKGRQVVGDIIDNITFQLPLYIVILLSVGMDIPSIAKAAMIQTLALLVLGAPYGYWLTIIR